MDFIQEQIDNLTMKSSVNISDHSILAHTVEWTVAFVIMYLAIFVIGIVGNCLVIIVIYKRRPLRNVTNAFLLNLAVADILVIVFCIPATLLTAIFTPWLLGSILCKGISYLQGVTVFASAYSLVTISLDRCLATLKPTRNVQGLSYSQAKFAICVIWMISLIAIFPWLIIFQTVSSHDSDDQFCVENWKTELQEIIYYGIVNLGFGYIFPLIMISVTNFLIWWKMLRPEDEHSLSSTIPQTAFTILHEKNKKEVRRMLKVTTIAFIICWLPLHFVITRVKLRHMVEISEIEMNFLRILIPFAQILGSFNSCINPLIYAFYSTKFRKSFKSILSKTWCSRRNNRDFWRVRFMTRNRPGMVYLETESTPVTRTSNFCISRVQMTPLNGIRRQNGSNMRNAVTSRSRCRRPQLHLYENNLRQLGFSNGAIV